MAYDFIAPSTATLKVPVAVNREKNIAQIGEFIAGYKVISIKGFKADGTLVEAQTLIDTILNEVGGGIYDAMKIQKILTYLVDDDADYIEIEFESADIAAVAEGTYTPVSQEMKSSVDSIFDGTYQVQGNVFSIDDFRG